jgi:hypothetical protein
VPAEQTPGTPPAPTQCVPLAFGVTVHEDVPLQIDVAQTVDWQLMGVPAQPPFALHESPYVHALWSSHAEPFGKNVALPQWPLPSHVS